MSLERERTLEQLEDFADEVDITRRERALFDLSNHTLHESSPSWRRGSETWRSREIFMVRKHLKDLSETMRPDVIRPEMFTNPLMRRMEAIREKARAGYRKDLLALCANRALSDDQLQDGRDAARLRYEKALAKLKPLEKRWELEVRIPMLIGSGVLKKSAEALLSRRS